MRKSIIIGNVLALGLSLASQAHGQEGLTLQLKWYPQVQFAGYFVADALGYYADERLQVTILPGGPDVDMLAALESGAADVIVDWLPMALAARQSGLPLVNIAQIYRNAGVGVTCLTSSNIVSMDDLRGKSIGVWPAGNDLPLLALLAHLGIPTNGGANGVTLVPQSGDVGLLIGRGADCVSTMSYNEYWELIEAGYDAAHLVTFPLSEQGLVTLEDGLYVLEESLMDGANIDRLARFVHATLRGWAYTAAHPDDAVSIVMDAVGVGAEGFSLQRLAAVNALVAASDGTAEAAAFEAVADYYREVGLINQTADGAYTKDVIEVGEELYGPRRAYRRP